MKFGTKNIADVKYGDKQIIRAYSGSNLVWEKNTQLQQGLHNGYLWIDLGLPSGTLWAYHNIGSQQPYENGNYYAWGETSTKSSYDVTNSSTNGVEISDYSGQARFDAATSVWGGNWRTPTKEDILELREYCTFEVVNSSQMFPSSLSDKIGLKIKGKNGRSIFVPYNGYMSKEYNLDNNIGMYFWSSTPNNDDTNNLAWSAKYPNEGASVFDAYLTYRRYGFAVRPVLDRSSLEL